MTIRKLAPKMVARPALKILKVLDSVAISTYISHKSNLDLNMKRIHE